MTERTISDEIRALEARCPDKDADPEEFRRNVERRAALSDKRRMYQTSGWKVA